MVPPRTYYARSGDLSIAYQVLGDGPIDLVWVPGWMSHLDFDWDDTLKSRFIQRLASFSRLVRFDKRGTGLSDPTSAAPTMEQRSDDVRAVMDAVEFERAAIFGHSEGGQMSAVFAATHPERVRSLVLYGTFARLSPDPRTPPTYPWTYSAEKVEQAKYAVEHWGDGLNAQMIDPSLASNPEAIERAARRERISASPAMARALQAFIFEADIRDVLPSIRVPTLVLHRTGDPFPVGGARYIAGQIPGARFVELAGSDHGPWVGNADSVLNEIEAFLTGARPSQEPDRVLATVLFTDIVGSTEHASRVGDRRWRELLDDHDRLVRDQLGRARGRAVKHTGDGFLATFDGPARAVRCAQAIRDAVRTLGIEVRAGLHTGECSMSDDDVGGIAVHIGQRVSGLAQANEILVSGTVKDLVVGSGLQFESLGMHTLRGLPDEWRIFRVVA